MTVKDHQVTFATPDGLAATADPILVTGQGSGLLKGVLLAALSNARGGKSVLHGRKTTALTKTLELTGWALTCAWMGAYYRTYPEPLQGEVKRRLANPADFISGPLALKRDSPENLTPGFTVQDGNCLSARRPGDPHRFAHDLVKMLGP